MLRLVDHPAWDEHAAALATMVRDRQRVATRLTVLRARLVGQICAAVPEAVHLFIPAGADQIERVFLALGTALGPEATAEVDEHLRRSPDDSQPLLDRLGQRLGDRPLVVDGWDCIGLAGVDRELGHALRSRTDALRVWLDGRAGLFVGQGRTPRSAALVDAPAAPPVELHNGAVQDTAALWGQVGRDPAMYTLALTSYALRATDDDPEDLPEPSVRARIIEMLPRSVALALLRVATHGRPLLPKHLPEGTDATTCALGQDLGLWSWVDEYLVPEPGWSDFLARNLSHDRRCKLHLELANVFLADFRRNDVTESRAGLSILEAHRHLVSAGEFERAREFWRYGAPLLIEAAREESMASRYGAAAQLYGLIVEAADRGEIPMPRRLRGYARHYLHFNRGHGEAESYAATERGYRRALQEWPENALFWSRLVRVSCLQGRAGTALDDLRTARTTVEEHPQKLTVLIARTARGLLDKRRMLDAVRVWGDYVADTPYALEVEDRLHAALAAGWETDRLILDPEQPLVFVQPIHVRVLHHDGRWSAELNNLTAFGDGAAAQDALQSLIGNLRQEVSALVSAYTTDLPATDRLRKRLLLGAVDVRASRVDGTTAATYWYFGKLHRDDRGALWLCTGGERDLWFEIPTDLSVVVDDLPHLARVATDERGVPVGPVLELLDGFRGSDDELWEAWRRLVADAG